METYIIILKVLLWISIVVCLVYAIFGKEEKPHKDKGFDDDKIKECTYIHDKGTNPCIKADFECYLCKYWK